MTSRYHFPPSMPPFAHKFHCPLEYVFFRLRAKLGVTLCVRFPLGCILLRVVGSCLKLVTVLSQQLPTFLLFHDRRSVAQQCWIRLQCSSKSYGSYPSQNTLHALTLSGVYASVCTPPPTLSFHICRTFSFQQCWEWSRPFARSLDPVTLL